MRTPRPWRRTVDITCEQASAELPLVLDSCLRASGPLVSHVESCLRCQAELARYRRQLRLLHQLQSSDIELPAGFLGDVLTALEQAANRRVVRSLLTGRREAYAGALVGAGAATAGILLLARSHARSARLERATGT